MENKKQEPSKNNGKNMGDYKFDCSKCGKKGIDYRFVFHDWVNCGAVKNPLLPPKNIVEPIYSAAGKNTSKNTMQQRIKLLNEWMLEKGLVQKSGITAFDWVDGEQRIKEINDIDYVAEDDLPRGDRKYYKRNELSENKITNDGTRYTNPQFTRFECCICLKIKHVSRLLVDYLGRCISCKHR